MHATVLGSVGGALGVAAHAGGAAGLVLARLARVAFVSGADLGLRTGAAVAIAGCVLALAALPARPLADAETPDVSAPRANSQVTD